MIRSSAAALLLSMTSAQIQIPSVASHAPADTSRKIHISLPTDHLSLIPIKRVKGAILLPAVINGQQVNILFDNGTDATVIDKRIAQESRMSLSNVSINMHTGLSKIPARIVQGSMVVGNTLNIQGQFLAADLSHISDALGTPVAAILGADALAAFVVVVNPEKDWIAFGLPGHIVVHGRSRTSIPKGAKVPPQLPITVAFAPGFRVHAAINGQPVTLLLDYGSTLYVSLAADPWNRIIPEADRKGTTLTSTTADGLHTKEAIGVAELDLGGLFAKQVQVSSESTPHNNYDGRLGLGILAATSTVLDMPKRTLVIFPQGQDITAQIENPS